MIHTWPSTSVAIIRDKVMLVLGLHIEFKKYVYQIYLNYINGRNCIGT